MSSSKRSVAVAAVNVNANMDVDVGAGHSDRVRKASSINASNCRLYESL